MDLQRVLEKRGQKEEELLFKTPSTACPYVSEMCSDIDDSAQQIGNSRIIMLKTPTECDRPKDFT